MNFNGKRRRCMLKDLYACTPGVRVNKSMHVSPDYIDAGRTPDGAGAQNSGSTTRQWGSDKVLEEFQEHVKATRLRLRLNFDTPFSWGVNSAWTRLTRRNLQDVEHEKFQFESSHYVHNGKQLTINRTT